MNIRDINTKILAIINQLDSLKGIDKNLITIFMGDNHVKTIEETSDEINNCEYLGYPVIFTKDDPDFLGVGVE